MFNEKELEKAFAKQANEPKPKKVNCGKCHGKGYIAQWRRVAGGVCFACNGSGHKNIYG